MKKRTSQTTLHYRSLKLQLCGPLLTDPYKILIVNYIYEWSPSEYSHNYVIPWTDELLPITDKYSVYVKYQRQVVKPSRSIKMLLTLTEKQISLGLRKERFK